MECRALAAKICSGDLTHKELLARISHSKAAPAPAKFERQEALKKRIVVLSEELAGFADLLILLKP